jgi:hypothetical protein
VIAFRVLMSSLVILLGGVASAHPVDDLCPPGRKTEDGCQIMVSALGFDNPEFYAARKGYWHCRRDLVSEDIVGIAQCVGGNLAVAAHLGESYLMSVGETALLTYWNVIPAHPELDYLDSRDIAVSIERARAQRGACDLTREIAAAVLYFCREKNALLHRRMIVKNSRPRRR